MHIDDARCVNLAVNPPWMVSFHSLYDVAPDVVDAIEYSGEVTVWETHFDEDLLQVVNKDTGQLIDVGWYPAGDPAGNYVLRVLQPMENVKAVDWDNPQATYRTRELADLVEHIAALTRNP